jgi:hypothetical protein
MANNKILQTFGIGATPGQSTTTWNQPGQQITILDATNPSFPRNFIMTNQGIRIIRGTTAAGVLLSDLAAALITLEPTLAYPPYFTTNPLSSSVAFGASTSFTVVVLSELSVTYQWQLSTNAGATWGNLTNTGVYSTVTTATLNISSVSGLHSNQYRCVATQVTTLVAVNSLGATLTVVPAISVQPANTSVVHPAAATFSVTASGTAVLAYQWQVSIDSGNTWVSITSAGTPNYSNWTTATLTVGTTATSMNGYQYRVIITDGNNQSTTSNSATLTVT